MLTSMPMLFFPRLECSSSTCTLPIEGMTPLEARPRMASPRSGCSILITSAPQSARMADAAGTNVCSATSRMRTPSMMSANAVPPVRCAWATRSPRGGGRFNQTGVRS